MGGLSSPLALRKEVQSGQQPAELLLGGDLLPVEFLGAPLGHIGEGGVGGADVLGEGCLRLGLHVEIVRPAGVQVKGELSGARSFPHQLSRDPLRLQS